MLSRGASVTIYTSPSGCYARLADGRRTRLLLNPERARLAAERGEVYTDEDYARLTTVANVPVKAHRKPAKAR